MIRLAAVFLGLGLGFAQSIPPPIAGDWQGTLQVGEVKLRLALHLKGAEGGAFSATLDSLDQHDLAIVVDRVTLDGQTLRLDLKSMQAVFEGDLGPGASEISGDWRQGERSFPLVFRRPDPGAVFAAPVKLPKDDREFLTGYLFKTRKAFVDSIKGLTPEQWTFKPAPDRWSIAEIAQRALMVEVGVYQMVIREVLPTPTSDDHRHAMRTEDEIIVKTVGDPNRKDESWETSGTPEALAGPSEAAEAFTRARQRLISYVLGDEDDLRGHFASKASAPRLDMYQYFLLIGADSARRTAQIAGIKADPHYPADRPK